MDYKQKYEEALERAREYWETDNDNTLDIKAKGTMEYLFPELAESENERIKKAIIATIHLYYGEPLEDEAKEMIAWLEKQGQKSIWHNEDEEPQRGSLILLIMQSGTPIVAKIIEPNHTFNHGERWAYIDDLLEKQGEQNPAWSEEDERAFHHVLSVLEEYGEEHPSKSKFVCNWLKSIKVKMGGDKV